MQIGKVSKKSARWHYSRAYIQPRKVLDDIIAEHIYNPEKFKKL